jgi:ribosome biogenesis GTPase A
MASYWKAVKRVIQEADMLLLLLDARYVDETRNEEIEEKVRSAGKPLIYVITKADLADRGTLELHKRNFRPSVFISVKDHSGRKMLKERIIIEAGKVYKEKERIRVGVLGYPNVGKSSLINLMKGKHSASTSSRSGHTKSTQLIKAGKKLYFIDTPGVIPYMEKDDLKHAITNVMDYTKAKDPDLIVINLMRKFPGRIEAHFGVQAIEDKEKTLEEIALKMNVLKKGGLPDVRRMAVSILHDFQKDKI